jgi:hypothetical protein
MTGSMVESRAGSRAEEDCGVRAEPAKIGRDSHVDRRTDATQWRPYPRQLGWYAVPTLPEASEWLGGYPVFCDLP